MGPSEQSAVSLDLSLSRGCVTSHSRPARNFGVGVGGCLDIPQNSFPKAWLRTMVVTLGDITQVPPFV